MRLLNTATISLETFIGHETPKYAILSHTWDTEEVTFDLIARPEVQHLAGYAKVLNACRQARTEGLDYIWIDTCCIDKSSSAELSEAINSMFSWYREAEICYAYLSDVEEAPDTNILPRLADSDPRYQTFPGPVLLDPYALNDLWSSIDHHDDQFANSRWFTRGWTLQELIAPSHVVFYSRSWTFLTTKSEACHTLAAITGVHSHYIIQHTDFSVASVAERMFWASARQTTRVEDLAYCLLGIFDVNMPLLYGEGKKAFMRLQEMIMKQTDDQTLFAWTRPRVADPWMSGLLAENPSYFKDSRFYVPCRDLELRETPEMTSRGLKIQMHMSITPRADLSIGTLNCTSGSTYHGLATIHLVRVNRNLPYYSRVKCSEIGSGGQRIPPPQLIYVNTCPRSKFQVWAESYFVLGTLSSILQDEFALKNIMLQKTSKSVVNKLILLDLEGLIRAI